MPINAITQMKWTVFERQFNEIYSRRNEDYGKVYVYLRN